jgi:hypothetical protein
VLPILFSALGLLLAAGLGYFIFIGVRAIYRGASATAQEAGHSHASAGRRATVRMLVWALSFGVLYFFLYFLGRRIGWWAVIPGALGVIAIIFALLRADRLLTSRPGAGSQQLTIGLVIVAVFAMLMSITWYAASTS